MNSEKTTAGMFYLKFSDETVSEAIKSHSVGFKSIEDAIGEAQVIEHRPYKFDVLDHTKKVVYSGSVNNG